MIFSDAYRSNETSFKFLNRQRPHRQGILDSLTKTNIFLATFTTSWARLKLNDVLDQLKENVLYHDTDSVIYTERRNAQTLSLRDYLGYFTDELEGHYIEEFVSGGPKHYAFRRSDGQEVCKVRGFSMNYENQNSSSQDADNPEHLMEDESVMNVLETAGIYNENQNDYTCTERAIVGTWCTPELNLARSKGYKIQKIYEEHRTYNPRTGKGGLFEAKLQEASGFPEECRMEQPAVVQNKMCWKGTRLGGKGFPIECPSHEECTAN
ncbi:unnamed protein product [Mytilus edulis]|uniref:DNA-directed DNA polymerase n=1 Tax=Mytilus edulis TaxID=6550 RepID=A0A8S3SLM5_MYTED|nr:unnamed protein product [Mytilus edulis]